MLCPQHGGDTPPPSVDQTEVVEKPESVADNESQQFNNQFNNYSTPIQQPVESDEVLNRSNVDVVSDSTPIQQLDDQGGGEGVLNSTNQMLNSADESESTALATSNTPLIRQRFKVKDRCRYVGKHPAHRSQYGTLVLEVALFDGEMITCIKPDGSYTTWLYPNDLELMP